MRRLVLLLVVAALAVAPATAVAQDEPSALRVTAVDTSEHPEVTVRVSAPRDLVGASLSPGAFSLSEADQARDVRVEQVKGGELEVVLVIDVSGSMAGEPMAAAKAAAAGFLGEMPADTRIAVVAFDDTVRVASPMSADRDAHRAAIAALTPSGYTALYEGINAGLEQFSGETAQRAVVVLSDGGDNASSIALSDVTGRIIGAGTTLHVVELQTSDTEPEILDALSSVGYGQHIAVTDPQALSAVYGRIASDLRDSYVLAYTSQARGRVDLTVAVEHPGGRSEVTHRVSMPSAPVRPFAPGIFASPWILFVGIILMFGAFLFLLLSVLWPGEARSQLAGRARAAGAGTLPGMGALASKATLVVEHNLERRGWSPSLNGSLERAGVNLRAGEYVVLSACAAIVAFAAGTVLLNVFIGLLAAGVTVILSVLSLKVLGDRRKAKFGDQLGETLQLMAGTLRAGYGLLQAIDAVAKESPSPTAEEFRRIVVETRLGRELDEALQAMDKRIGSEDFSWVVQAINIHHEVGGDLAEVLDSVAGTIRERNQIRRQVKALSAEGKLSAVVLYVLPFGVAGFISLTNPSYLSPLVTEPIGWVMLGVGAVLLTLGGLWLRKVVKIVF